LTASYYNFIISFAIKFAVEVWVVRVLWINAKWSERTRLYNENNLTYLIDKWKRKKDISKFKITNLKYWKKIMPFWPEIELADNI
jgi:hypothetical protein